MAVLRSIISGAEGIVKTGANLGYPAAIPFQIIQGIQTLLQIAIIKSQKFIGGGRIPPGHELPGYSRQGDNTLILAKPGEVVLNQAQQAAIGGAPVFRKIGVPGFASGGMVQGAQSWNMNDFINQLASKMNTQKVVLSLNDLDSAQKEVRIVRKSNGL